ncbi:restriction endonuclease subunit S [Latilactobacillus graminis]|uniref:Restriction endonuclease subunit S n=1 Tax=Latilactobacillus graminis TaxID=60519 RepID=A0ABX6C8P0_9LACO|nr:restriction endonuclease subunit S [Latilactobacillus graminis]QFP79374.1 restriction endonuclease subunit S [Latilactobacillus graminis]
MKEQKKQPELRFRGFTDDWEQVEFQSKIKLIGGATPFKDNPEYWNGNIVWLSSQEIKNKYVSNGTYTITKKAIIDNKTRMVDAGTPLIVTRSGILAKRFPLSIPTIDVAINQDIKALLFDQSKLNVNFFVAELQSKEAYILKKIIKTGTTVQSVNLPDLNKLIISVVSDFKEQEKIGDFFQKLDHTIALQQRKLELLKKLKRGYLQQVLPAKNEFIPNIRFVNYFNDWKYITLSDLFKYEQPAEYIVKSTAYDVNFKIPVLTAGKSFILGYTDEKFGIKLASSDAPAIIFDDFTVSSHFVDFPFKVKSSALKILSLQNNQNNFYFAYNILKRINYKPQNHSRHWISKFSQFSVAIPTPDEQQNIGNFIKIIDNTLLLQEDKIKKIIDLKKGYLQKLFL